MDFKEFDPNIGVEGYCRELRSLLFPNSAPDTVNATSLNLGSRTYPKGSVFSRVRRLSEEDAKVFQETRIAVKEFLPPRRFDVEVSAGRFNKKGERKLYLADHPYVAMRECRIKPGEYFLLSQFSLDVETTFVEAENTGGEFMEALISILRSEDIRFHEVTAIVADDYLNYDAMHGIAYNSVRVPVGHEDPVFGKVTSTTNLVMKEQYVPSAQLLAGWLFKCDEDGHPSHVSLFVPCSQKKKKKLTTIHHRANKRLYLEKNQKLLRSIQAIAEKAERSIPEIDRADLMVGKFLSNQ